ncbi:hypothetical protein GQ457_18G012580 [Hibiscus cannabinus]
MRTVNKNKGSKIMLMMILTMMMMLPRGTEAVKLGCIIKCNLFKCIFPGTKSKEECIVDCMEGCHHKRRPAAMLDSQQI